MRSYRSTEKGAAANRKHTRTHYSLNAEAINKKKAAMVRDGLVATRSRAMDAVYNKVHYALRTGRLVKGPCARCGSTERVQAHHADYTKPLDVEWLCHPCHVHEHHQTSL